MPGAEVLGVWELGVWEHGVWNHGDDQLGYERDQQPGYPDRLDHVECRASARPKPFEGRHELRGRRAVIGG